MTCRLGCIRLRGNLENLAVLRLPYSTNRGNDSNDRTARRFSGSLTEGRIACLLAGVTAINATFVYTRCHHNSRRDGELDDGRFHVEKNVINYDLIRYRKNVVLKRVVCERGTFRTLRDFELTRDDIVVASFPKFGAWVKMT